MIPEAIGVENEVPCIPSLVHPEEVVVDVYRMIKNIVRDFMINLVCTTSHYIAIFRT